MATANDILKIARAEIGYTEGKNNSNKYGKEYGLDNQPYCVIWIWFIFKHANASALFYGGNKVALCSALYNYHKAKGQAITPVQGNFKPGDIVFFDFSGKKVDTSHVGIVESTSGSNLITIEGNTSSGTSGSQSNGDGVYRRTRAIKYVSKAYRPNYEGDSSVDDPYTLCVKELQTAFNARGARLAVDGEVGKDTEAAMRKYTTYKYLRNLCATWIQKRLVVKGYDIGPDGVDGVYGVCTANAVAKFQEDNGLIVDKVVGINTYKALLK